MKLNIRALEVNNVANDKQLSLDGSIIDSLIDNKRKRTMFEGTKWSDPSVPVCWHINIGADPGGALSEKHELPLLTNKKKYPKLSLNKE